MIRTFIVENENKKEIEIRVGWKYDKTTEICHAQYLTHDINQDANGIIEDINEQGHNFSLIGEIEPT